MRFLVKSWVMGRGSRHLLDLNGDGVGLEDAYPDGHHRVGSNILQHHDGHVGGRVHHQAANPHLDIHWLPSFDAFHA